MTDAFIVFFGVLALAFAGGVLLARQPMRAALALVAHMISLAGIFACLNVHVIALFQVLIYVGAVIILLLFGIMITRAPTGFDETLSGEHQLIPALLAAVLFGLITWGSLEAFGTTTLATVGEPTSTELLGRMLVTRFVIPFEVVGFVLLAALIGGITIARRDLTPLEEQQSGAV